MNENDDAGEGSVGVMVWCMRGRCAGRHGLAGTDGGEVRPAHVANQRASEQPVVGWKCFAAGVVRTWT